MLMEQKHRLEIAIEAQTGNLKLGSELQEHKIEQLQKEKEALLLQVADAQASSPGASAEAKLLLQDLEDKDRTIDSLEKELDAAIKKLQLGATNGSDSPVSTDSPKIPLPY